MWYGCVLNVCVRYKYVYSMSSTMYRVCLECSWGCAVCSVCRVRVGCTVWECGVYVCYVSHDWGVSSVRGVQYGKW